MGKYEINIHGEIIRDNARENNAKPTPSSNPNNRRQFNFIWLVFLVVAFVIGYFIITNWGSKKEGENLNAQQTNSSQTKNNPNYSQPSTTTYTSTNESPVGNEENERNILNGKWVQVEGAYHGTREIGLTILFNDNTGTIISVPSTTSGYQVGQVKWKDFDPEKKWIKDYFSLTDVFINKGIKFEDSNTINIYGDVYKRQDPSAVEIQTTIPAYPGKEKIKTDLLGKRISNWKFDYLEEFQDFNIVKEQVSNDYLYQTISLTLADLNSGKKYNSEIVTMYFNGSTGWEFSSVTQTSYSEILTTSPSITEQSNLNQEKSIPSATTVTERNNSAQERRPVSAPVNNFSGHYSGIISDKGYTKNGEDIYYKTFNCSVDDAFFMDRNDNKVSSNILSEGEPLYLSMTLGNFTKKSGKFRYTMSSYMEDQGGTVYAKSENVTSESSTPYLGLAIGGGLRSLPGATNRLNLYISFRIDDRFSDAKIEGFFKIVVVR